MKREEILERKYYENRKKIPVQHGHCSLKSFVLSVGTVSSKAYGMYLEDKEKKKTHGTSGYYIDVSTNAFFSLQQGFNFCLIFFFKIKGKNQTRHYYVYLHELDNPIIDSDNNSYEFVMHQPFFMPKVRKLYLIYLFI